MTRKDTSSFQLGLAPYVPQVYIFVSNPISEQMYTDGIKNRIKTCGTHGARTHLKRTGIFPSHK